MAMQVKRIYLLGDHRLEPDKRLLSREGRVIHLANRPFQVLLYLIEHRERVVSRHELLERFWGTKDVYDLTLTQCVGAIRKALGDHPRKPRFIETRHAEGYRYIGPVEEQVAADEAPRVEIERTRGVEIIVEEEDIAEPAEPLVPISQRHFPWSVALTLAAAVLAATLAGVLLSRGRSGRTEVRTSPIRSIAVLPLRDLTGDAAQEYFIDGLTESLITALSKIKGLKVISRGSVFAFKGKDVDPREAGRRLGVAAVLEGSLRKSGDNFRVDVRLVSTEDGRVLWASNSDEHSPGDILMIQDEIARGILSGLKLKLTDEGESRLSRGSTENVEAYRAYLKGLYFWNKRSPEGLKKAFYYFNQAIVFDPGYGLAYAGLASSHVTSIWFLNEPPNLALAKAKEPAQKAIEIDPQLAEAHIAIASVYANSWNLPAAIREQERAIELKPGLALAHHEYAYSLVLTGRPDEAVGEIKLARELDPLNVVSHIDVGEILLYAERYDEALDALKGAIEMDPNRANAHRDLAQVYEQKGMYQDAISEYTEAAILEGDSPRIAASLKQGYARSGMRGFWQQKVRLARARSKRGYYDPYSLARIYARLGDEDRAFQLLEEAFQEHSPYLIGLKVDPLTSSLRSDRRYSDLFERMRISLDQSSSEPASTNPPASAPH